MTGENNNMEHNNGVKVPTGQINYNTVGASAGIASFLGINARNLLNGTWNNGNTGWNGNQGCPPPCSGIHGYAMGFEQGRKNQSYFEDTAVTQIEMGYAQELNKKDAEIAKLISEKYTDTHILEAYRETVNLFKAEDEKISSIVKDVTSSFIETGKELAVLNTKVQCLEERMVSMNAATNERLGYEIKGVYRDINSTKHELESGIALESERRSCGDKNLFEYINGAKRELEGGIALEAERRCCGDKNLFEYVNGTFVPGKLVMPSSSVCPQPMPQYNSWTAPTTTTTTTP